MDFRTKGGKENVLFSDHVYRFVPFTAFNQLITHIVLNTNITTFNNITFSTDNLIIHFHQITLFEISINYSVYLVIIF